jgi:hypothetical protein
VAFTGLLGGGGSGVDGVMEVLAGDGGAAVVLVSGGSGLFRSINCYTRAKGSAVAGES